MNTQVIDQVKITRKGNLSTKPSSNEKFVTSFLKRMDKGCVSVTLPDGTIVYTGDPEDDACADIKITNGNFFKKLKLYGDVGFGEAYVEGFWDTMSITKVISWVLLNFDNMPGLSGSKGSKFLWNIFQFANKTLHKTNKNTKKGSQKNISHHYDLSNDFYQLWLDPSMTYSSAYYDSEKNSLYEAQQLKYKKITEKLQLSDNDEILEIGCGWGGMAIYIASNFNVKITGITISQEQFDYATKKVAEAGLSDKVKIVFKDYRNLKGKFDKIVSIEMIEAVGHEFYKSYFQKIHELLKPNGIVVIQVITSPDSRYEALKSNVDWIQKHIFPGSLLPSISILNKNVNRTGYIDLVNLE
jgi:cyclopropane-fatty-acyl-phospholipid synthase